MTGLLVLWQNELFGLLHRSFSVLSHCSEDDMNCFSCGEISMLVQNQSTFVTQIEVRCQLLSILQLHALQNGL